jgi:hypothetical protein
MPPKTRFGRRRGKSGKGPSAPRHVIPEDFPPLAASTSGVARVTKKPVYHKDPAPIPLLSSPDRSNRAATRAKRVQETMPVPIFASTKLKTAPPPKKKAPQSKEADINTPSNLATTPELPKASPATGTLATLSSAADTLGSGVHLTAPSQTDLPDDALVPLNLNVSLAAVKHLVKSPPDPAEFCSVNRGSKKTILHGSELRDFTYPIRDWDKVARPPIVVTDDEEEMDWEDPYHDFPTEELDPPKIRHEVKGFYLEEILENLP